MSKKGALSEETKLQIAELYQENDLSVGAIAERLGVSPRSVHNYKNYQKTTNLDDVQLGKDESYLDTQLTKEEETNLQIYEMIHSGYTDSEISQKVGLSEDTVRSYRNDQDDDHEKDSENIQAEPEKINFVGGKKHLEPEEELKEEKEHEWECGECHGEFDGKPDRCPHCGSELEWEESGGILWPVLALGGLGLVGYFAYRNRINNQNQW